MRSFHGYLRLFRSFRSEGSALIVTLIFVTLTTILVIGVLSVVTTERISANGNFETQGAHALANMGVDNAVALIRDATTAGTVNGKFWSSQPGKITVFNNGDGTVDAADSRYLFSTNTTSGTVNINQTGFSGVAPVASANSVGAGAAPDMEVSWVNVLQSPLSAASAANQIIGRYAFWADDETAKVDLNTADGTDNYNAANNVTNNYGPGTPTAASLSSLQSGGANLSTAVAQAIAAKSGARYDSATSSRPFNDPSESLQATGVPSTFAQDNNFTTTHYSRAPEQNIFGEPRINLTTTLTTAAGAIQDAMLGPYGTLNNSALTTGGPLNCIYPLSSQLPTFVAPGVSRPLPQYFQADGSIYGSGNSFTNGSPDYELGMRIARYLQGYNSQGNSIQWPLFPGSSTSGFAGKYTLRQIDSIALQILTLLKRGTFADHYRGYATPYVMPKGFLSGQLVRGLALTPRVNEIYVQVTTAKGNPPTFNMRIVVEWYFPKEFQGASIPANRAVAWTYGNAPSYANVLNAQDAPAISTTPYAYASVTGPSPLGGYWMDNMITDTDQTGAPAGIDFCGNNPSVPDPDQTRSLALHPSAGGMGTGPRAGYVSPILQMYNPALSVPWNSGDYHATQNAAYSAFYPMKPGTTSVTLAGGLAIGLHTESGTPYNGYSVDPVPLDSIRGPFTGESLSNATTRAAVLQAVIPVNVTVPVPGTVTLHMQVADPLVNSFPGDWMETTNAPASTITMTQPMYNIPTVYTSGQNILPTPANKTDPQSNWWPPQSTSLTKSQRFPSLGYLQYIRTGIMPDKQNDSLPIPQEKGTPYRGLNFAPSTDASQQTAGGSSYPDWAMLDLFTTPADLQPLAANVPNPIQLTWGGATAGRINPNLIALPFSSVLRFAPLESLLKGVRVSTAYNSSGTPLTNTVDETALTTAISQYLSNQQRPFMMPAEICNVPAVANYLYTGGNSSATSRNDLVRQVVGNLTTRSNTFTIWAIGQVIKKAPGHTSYGTYETGDIILGESKLQVLVERRLDYGADNIAGNSQNPGPDGITGTPDDPIDVTYNPTMTYPLSYKYRIISVREITN